MPARRRTSTTEEHAKPLSLPRAPSNERSLLSQQIRVNSGSSIHSLTNGIQPTDSRPLEDSKAECMDEHLYFPAPQSPGASVPDQASPPQMNGVSRGGSSTGLPKRQPEMHDGSSPGLFEGRQGLRGGSDFESHVSPQGLQIGTSLQLQSLSSPQQLGRFPECEWQPNAPPQHEPHLLVRLQPTLQEPPTNLLPAIG